MFQFQTTRLVWESLYLAGEQPTASLQIFEPLAELNCHEGGGGDVITQQPESESNRASLAGSAASA
jgi:hypothetical protein